MLAVRTTVWILKKIRDTVPLIHAVKLYIEFYCKILEQILKDISEKIRIGELEDASETIGQMGKGFKQTKAGKPKSVEGKTKQAEQERKDGKVSIYSSGWEHKCISVQFIFTLQSLMWKLVNTSSKLGR